MTTLEQRLKRSERKMQLYRRALEIMKTVKQAAHARSLAAETITKGNSM